MISGQSKIVQYLWGEKTTLVWSDNRYKLEPIRQWRLCGDFETKDALGRLFPRIDQSSKPFFFCIILHL